MKSVLNKAIADHEYICTMWFERDRSHLMLKTPKGREVFSIWDDEIMNTEDLSSMSLDKLRRKRDQAWDLAGCARQDGDSKDEVLWTAKAREYAIEISKRIREES